MFITFQSEKAFFHTQEFIGTEKNRKKQLKVESSGEWALFLVTSP